MTHIVLAIIGILLAALARLLGAVSLRIGISRPACTAIMRLQEKALADLWWAWSVEVLGIPSFHRARRALVAPAQRYSAP